MTDQIFKFFSYCSINNTIINLNLNLLKHQLLQTALSYYLLRIVVNYHDWFWFLIIYSHRCTGDVLAKKCWQLLVSRVTKCKVQCCSQNVSYFRKCFLSNVLNMYNFVYSCIGLHKSLPKVAKYIVFSASQYYVCHQT